MKLFGFIDPLWWTVLWCLAENADEKGHVYMYLHEIAAATVRDEHRLCKGRNSTLGRMKDAGLVRVARKRVTEYQRQESGQVIPVETKQQVLELYAGILRGKVPAAGAVIQGLSATWWRRGRQVKSQTHKLIRDKFKPVEKPPRKLTFSEIIKAASKKKPELTG